MLFINTANNARRKAQRCEAKRSLPEGDAKLESKTITFAPCLFTLSVLLICGCAQNDTQKAQGFALKSEAYYQKAVQGYKKVIAQAKGIPKAYLSLGALYYSHGDFDQAISALKKSQNPSGHKLLAIAEYRAANFTDALELFNSQELPDDEYRYFHGLTCEKLNLFDKALGIYSQISSPQFLSLAKQRMGLIEKQPGGALKIKDLSPKMSALIESASDASGYPQAGALILFCDEHVEISPDNREVSTLHYLIKILNQRGKENFSETHLEYDSTFEKVELEFARTIKPDGTVVEVGSRHIRDVSKYLNFPLYSNARIFIISFPEITEGALIEYQVRIYNNQLINKKDFFMAYPLKSSEPLLRASFTVTVPKAKTLYRKLLNEQYNNSSANLVPAVETLSDRVIYRWQFKDVPQIIPENKMPPEAQVNPTILLSTLESWQGLYDWWWKLAKDKISPDAAIKEKVRALIAGKSSAEEKARSIYTFCSQEIRYVAVEYGQAGYEPHPAADIFKNKYGDCKDQAILLVTMLKEAGLSAWPVLISTREYYNPQEDFPTVLFNHCIAALALGEKTIFLDPTASTCSFGDLPQGDQARRVFVCKEDGYKILETPLFPSQHNFARQELKLTIANDESVFGEKINYTFGVYDQAQRYWLKYTQPELIEQSLKERIQEISIGGVLKSFQIEHLDNLNLAVVLRYAFSASEYCISAGSLRILPQLATLDTTLVAKDERNYSIDFGVLDAREWNFEITLPDDFVVQYIPESVHRESPWLTFKAEYVCKGKVINFTQRVELKRREVTPGEYPEFKRFVESLAKAIHQRLVLKKSR